MVRKLLIFPIYFIIFLLLFTGCQQDNDITHEESDNLLKRNEQLIKPSIAFFSIGVSNDYVKTGIRAAEETTEKLGGTIDIYDGQFNSDIQNEQVLKAITTGKYNAFIIEAVDGIKMCNTVGNAIKAGIRIAVINVTLCGAEDWYPETITFVGGQTYKIYEDFVTKIIEENPNGGKIAAISGPSTGTNALNMKKALDNVLLKNPHWELVALHSTDYTPNQGFQAAQDILIKHPDTNIIFSNYSGLTIGIAEALKVAKKQNISIYDMGGNQWAFQAIEEGKIKMSVIMLPYTEVQRAVEAIFLSFRGKSVKKFYNLTKEPNLPGTPYITKENIKEFRKNGLPEY